MQESNDKSQDEKGCQKSDKFIVIDQDTEQFALKIMND